MIAWSTLAACAGWCADVVGREPLRDLVRRAPATISSPLRERSSRAAVTSARQRLLGHRHRARRSTISQRTPPASAASTRRVSSPTVASSSVPRTSSWCTTVVEPLLTDRERTRLDHGTERLRGEHGGGYPSSMALLLGCSRDMTVPLFDTKTPLAPLRDALHAKAAEVLDAGRYILGPEVAAFEERARGHLGAAARDRRRQRHRRARPRPARAGRRPRRRRRRPVVHVLRLAPRRSPLTGADPVFCDIDPVTFCVTPDTVRAALTPEHEGGHRRPPVRQRRAGRGDRGARRPRPRGRRPGRRLAHRRRRAAPARSAPRPRSRSSRRRTSAPSATAARSRPATTRSPRRCAMLRFHGSRDKVTFELVGHNSRLDELQAALLRLELPHLDAWCDGRRAAAAHYAEAGPRRARRAAAARRRLRARLAPLRDPPRAADALAAASGAAAIGSKRYYTRAAAPAAGDARRGATSSCPARTRRRARTSRSR